MKLHLGVALLVSVTNLSVCLMSSIPKKSSVQEKSHFLPDWSIQSLCDKLRKETQEEEGLLVLVSITGSNTKPKIFRKGCFLLQSKRFDGPYSGMIDPDSRYFTPRTYGSIYNNKKMRCAPFIEEKMPESFNPFTETLVTGLEAVQVCKFFSQSSETTGEKRFVPRYMPLVLNVESKLRCIRWAFDYQEQETWVKEIVPDCTQPLMPVKKSTVIIAMSEATCEFYGGEITCKPVDTLHTKVTRLNLLFASHKREIKERKAGAKTNKRNSKAPLSSKENEVVDKYIERTAQRERRNKVQKVEENKAKSSDPNPEKSYEYEYKCENCRRVKKSNRKGNFKITIDAKSKPKSSSSMHASSSSKYAKAPVLAVPKPEKRELIKNRKVNDSVENSDRKAHSGKAKEPKIIYRNVKEKLYNSMQ